MGLRKEDIYRDKEVKADKSVLSRLSRLDKDFYVTFSRWAIDPQEGCVIESPPHVDTETGKLIKGKIEEPCFYLWIKTNDGDYGLVNMYPKKFGHKEVERLEGSLSRFLDPGEVVRRVVEAREEKIKRERAAYEDMLHQRALANKTKALEVAEGKTSHRERKIASFPGQKHRGSPSGLILPDGKESGWEGTED